MSIPPKSDHRHFSAILFDMDGLMVDTERLYVQANEVVAAGYGRTVTMSTIAKMMGRGTLESLRIFADDLKIPAAPELLAQQRQDIMLKLVQTDLETMPGLRELLAYVRPRYRVALATGSPQCFMAEIIAKLSLVSFFDITQSSDGIEFGKPHPEVYLRTCQRLGVRPQDCIVLEDSANGVRSGVSAGCFVIAVPNVHTLSQDLSPAHLRLPDLHAVQAWIEADHH